MLLGLLQRAILFCVLLSRISPAQSYLFASPNTRDHLSDEAAADSLNSFEQSNFLAVAKYLAGKICPTPQVMSAEGIYAGNAENSSLVTGCKKSQAQYLGELLGRYAHQKWVLVFDPSAGGNERMLIVEFNSDHPAEEVTHVRQYNISGATVLFQGKTIRVYIWTTDHSQDAAVHALADAEHGSVREIPGKGTLIGDDDRTAAQSVFEQRIHAYERVHHRSLSRLLWSRQLHDLRLARSP
ncbi:MAG TPA: hypothetical protein VI685_10415 [Candidatus Angelobacter sp.]